MILFGSFQVVPVITVISTVGLVFASVYSLIMIQRAYYGTPKSDQPLPCMTARELFTILLLVVLVLLVLLGVYPQPILDTSAVAMSNVQHWFASSVSAISTTRP